MTRTTCRHCGAAFAGGAVHCPDCRDTAAPWRVDDAALARACDHLGIKVPVRVRRMPGRGLRGRYHGIRLAPDAPRDPAVFGLLSDAELTALMHHQITVATRLTPSVASRVLWHELTHAAQFEHDADGYIEGYARERAAMRAHCARTGEPWGTAYRRISYETEATANEGLHDDRHPLTLPNRRCTLRRIPDHPFVVAATSGRLELGRLAAGADDRQRADVRAARRRLRARA
jgi:hypothetical protein